MVKNLNFDLAQEMDNVLNNEEYQKIFSKPKFASKIEKKASRNLDNVKNIFDALLEVSAELDEFGLTKSSIQALKVADSIISEAHEEVDEPNDELESLLKELGQDNEGQDNEVIDVPSDMDKPEGNPETL